MPRGRNKALIARRDEMLCHRYHYWTETQRLRFDDTLKILVEEIVLSLFSNSYLNYIVI